LNHLIALLSEPLNEYDNARTTPQNSEA